MSKKNVKITDVASAAGVSQSAVSFVLSGRGDEMHISKDTQKNIWETARELGYSPSNLTRRIKKPITIGVPTMTIFWTVDRSYTMLTRSLVALQNSIVKKNLNLQVVMRPFISGHLSDALKKSTEDYFSGAIIGGATDIDMEAVSGLDISMPIVFFERTATKFNSVYTNFDFGLSLAEAIADKGFKNVLLLLPHDVGPNLILRCESIQRELKKRGIRSRKITAKDGISNLDFGKEIAVKTMTGNFPADVLCFMQEEIAVGGVDGLRSINLTGGRDVELISYGTGSHLDYLGMPITRIIPQIEQLSDLTIDVLLEQISNPGSAPRNVAVGCEIQLEGRLK